ncbi:MAG: hypothetical protein AAB421_04915 [Patescibacteria group bacterium]
MRHLATTPQPVTLSSGETPMIGSFASGFRPATIPARPLTTEADIKARCMYILRHRNGSALDEVYELIDDWHTRKR